MENENNKLMVVENENDEIEEYSEEYSEESRMSTGLAMLIGSGLTLATVAGVKLFKNWRANKKKNEEECEDSEVEVKVEVEPDEVVDETKKD